jgi:hypothetical protein
MTSDQGMPVPPGSVTEAQKRCGDAHDQRRWLGDGTHGWDDEIELVERETGVVTEPTLLRELNLIPDRRDNRARITPEAVESADRS